MKLTEEERKRRSELAKQLHEKGKFGGNQKGAGRPKKQRAQEVVAEKIREESDNIFRALKSSLKANSPSIRLKAALAMLEIETKEEELQIKEEQRQFDNLNKDQMIGLIQERLAMLKESGINIPGFIDGTATEVPIKELESETV